MGEVNPPLTVEQFYKFIGEGRLMAAKCSRCGSIFIPPRTICAGCLSSDLGWVEVERRGRLLTYTVIYIPPVQFQEMAPYIYGIVELKDGPRIPGIVRGVDPKDVEVGMELVVDFETEPSEEWPGWPRYFFRPP